jgi:hypothetical protein
MGCDGYVRGVQTRASKGLRWVRGVLASRHAINLFIYTSTQLNNSHVKYTPLAPITPLALHKKELKTNDLSCEGY